MKTLLKKLLCCTLAMLMLITMLAACGKEDEPEQTQSESSDTEAPETVNTHMKAAFTEAVLMGMNGEYEISNVTYNAHNNPISEKIVGIYEVDGHTDIKYDYNEYGRITKVTATVNWLDDDYGMPEEYFCVEYVVDGTEYKSAKVNDSETLTSTVEYHDNGTLKKLWIGDAEETGWCIEQDSMGRRTVYKDDYKDITLTYSGDSREIVSGVIGDQDYDKNNEQYIRVEKQVQFEYANGVLAKMTVNEADGEKEVFELAFSDGVKNLTATTYYWYKGTELREQMRYELAYTDFGMFKSFTWIYYEDGALDEGEIFEYEYDSANRVVKITSTCMEANDVKYVDSVITMEYDANGRKAKSTETWYDETGAKEDTLVETFEYNADGKCTKSTYYRTNADGSIDNHYETTQEYGSNGKISKHVYTKMKTDGTVDYRDETVFAYDADGKVTTTSTRYDANGNAMG